MIVGFVGFIGSGKGTAGDILEQEYGFAKESFAKGVKDIAAVMFGWPRHMLEGDTDESRVWREQSSDYWTKKFGRSFTPREALQLVGTEVGREIFHENFWVMNLENRINKNNNYVITDVRFPNEIKWIQNSGGIVIEIQRGKNPSWYDTLYHYEHDSDYRRDYMKKYNVHESEWAWVGHSMNETIQNNGTKNDLKRNVISALTKSFGASKINELIHDGEKNEVI
jgi:hypothetical protein